MHCTLVTLVSLTLVINNGSCSHSIYFNGLLLFLVLFICISFWCFLLEFILDFLSQNLLLWKPKLRYTHWNTLKTCEPNIQLRIWDYYDIYIFTYYLLNTIALCHPSWIWNVLYEQFMDPLLKYHLMYYVRFSVASTQLLYCKRIYLKIYTNFSKIEIE